MPESSGGRGAGSVQLGFGWPWTFAVEPRLRLGVTSRLDLELNALVMAGPLAKASTHPDVTLSLGLQWQVVKHRWFRLALRGGAGGGRGGSWEEKVASDPDHWEHHEGGFAGGAYAGLDLGFRVHRRVGLFLGNTFDVSAVDDPHIPVTFWGYHAWGIQLDWTPSLFFSIENGLFWYANSGGGYYNTTVLYVTLLGYRWGQ
jgi:hypothetical protein